MAMPNILLCSILCLLSASVAVSQDVNANWPDNFVVEYLHKYGYISSLNATEEDIASGVRKFQRIAGIAPTGVVDVDTLEQMKLPRCGNSDNILCPISDLDAVFKASKTHLFVLKGKHYWIASLDTKAVSQSYQIVETWPETGGYIDAALLYFERTYLFKHNFYWKYKQGVLLNGPQFIGTNFIGIPDDVDAALEWQSKLYFFKGSDYWRFEINDKAEVVKGYPKKIKDGWIGVPDDVDAAVQIKGVVYFFKKDKYFKYQARNQAPIEAKPISELFNCREDTNVINLI